MYSNFKQRTKEVKRVWPIYVNFEQKILPTNVVIAAVVVAAVVVAAVAGAYLSFE